MGGCVASIMERKNDNSIEVDERYAQRLAYGTQNVKFTDDEERFSGIYRAASLTQEEHNRIQTGWYYESNLLQNLEKNCRERGEKRAIAYRKVAKITTEVRKEGDREKQWEFVHLEDPTYVSYAEFWGLLTSFGRGLVSLCGLGKGSKVGLYEETRWEWFTSMMGLWTQEMVGVTVYANLGQDALIYALKEAECGALICNGKNVEKILQMMDASDDALKETTIIYLDELPAGVNAGSHRVLSWHEVLEHGQKVGDTVPYTVTDNNDLEVLVMYTSGTTGNPKGVIHSIGALTQGARGLDTRLTECLGKTEEETYVSYLPAAHIFEFICENIMLSRGILLCFGSPRTLMDNFARPHGDLTEYKPFFMIGVPRIFETIKKTVESRLPPVGSLRRRIFDTAFDSKLSALREGKNTPYWNEKVFKLPSSLLGPNMRGICSGGAPLADKTQEWVNVVLSMPVAQGYGMTETVCNGCVQQIGELPCLAGQLLWGVEARLMDTEEYKHTDKPNPRGELLLRGNFMFKGYYAQPELTKECMMEDGWLRTGDVAEANAEDGEFKIIGRVKALAKNVLGEYIALESLEALYSLHPVVMPNGICVLVDPHKNYICALVLTDEDKAMRFANEQRLPGKWPAILETDAFQQAVARSMSELAKSEGRMPFECLRHVRVLADEWTPENGLVTASLKVRRSEVDKHYKDIIAKLFVE